MSRRVTIIIEDDGTAQGLGYESYVPFQRAADPCQFCQSNPAVNRLASGVCNCALPALVNPVIC